MENSPPDMTADEAIDHLVEMHAGYIDAEHLERALADEIHVHGPFLILQNGDRHSPAFAFEIRDGNEKLIHVAVADMAMVKEATDAAYAVGATIGAIDELMHPYDPEGEDDIATGFDEIMAGLEELLGKGPDDEEPMFRA